MTELFWECEHSDGCPVTIELRPTGEPGVFAACVAGEHVYTGREPIQYIADNLLKLPLSPATPVIVEMTLADAAMLGTSNIVRFPHNKTPA
jgi:hypothetical protein